MIKPFKNQWPHCRDPSLRDTWHASYSDTWHALSSGSSSSGPSHKAHMARFSGLPQGRSNDTYKHIIRTTYTIHPDDQGLPQGRSNGTYKHIIRTIYTMHPDDQHRPSGYNGPDHWLKYSESYTLSRQPAMAHVPSPAEWKDGLRWQQVTSHDHSTWSLPTISDSRITYHGF